MNLIWTWKFWFGKLDSFSADSRIMAWVLTPSIYYLRKRLETVQIKHTLSEIKTAEIWLSNFVTWKLPKFLNICYTPNFSLTISNENKLWGLFHFYFSFLIFVSEDRENLSLEILEFRNSFSRTWNQTQKRIVKFNQQNTYGWFWKDYDDIIKSKLSI